MTQRPQGNTQGVLVVILLVSAVVTLVALWVWGADQRRRRTESGSRAQGPAPAGVVTSDAPVVALAEAAVFRIAPGSFAADTGVPRRRDAHPRTLASYRARRAFPGAPPRIPHGLTAEELAAPRCNACHARGGYSPRFLSYTPVTPHPELSECTQCHLVDDAVAGVPFPRDAGDGTCRQCHAPSARPVTATLAGWEPAPWPRVRGPRPDGTPPSIPHELALRGNCLACHMGPGAVEEVRTRHPERADCRGCHVEGGDAPAERDEPSWRAIPAGGAR